VFIYAIASHGEYPDSRNATITIVVYPETGKFLSMVVDQLGGDLVEEGRTTLMRVRITDQDENPVFGSDVVITSEPPAAISPSSGLTDTNGFINGIENIEFEAPEVEEDQDYLITITATLADHEPTERSFTLTVAEKAVAGGGGDLTWLFIVVGVIVAVVVVALVVMTMMGGKRKRRRKIKKLKKEEE
jgi:hypothetical protein